MGIPTDTYAGFCSKLNENPTRARICEVEICDVDKMDDWFVTIISRIIRYFPTAGFGAEDGSQTLPFYPESNWTPMRCQQNRFTTIWTYIA
jgi:hypothetical protein